MKQCRKCKIYKEDENFHWRKKGVSRHNECKDCRSSKKEPIWSDTGRVCNNCKNFQSLDQFHKRTNGAPTAVCKTCRNKNQRDRTAILDPEEINRQCKKCKEYKDLSSFPLNKNSKNGRWSICKVCHVILNRSRMFNITPDEYLNLIKQQDNKCCICKKELSETKKIHLDHDHSCCSEPGKSCGKCIRGILCHSCNVGLGFFCDDSEILKLAIEYLENSKRT